MYELHWTFEDIKKCTMDQLNFISEGIRVRKEMEAKIAKKAGSKARRGRRR